MRQSRADLEYLATPPADGALVPLIERRHPLREAAAAVRHLHLGHAQGKTVLLA
ncbi:zinc-binding dehydrogenase [Nocardia sp. NPDC003345]